MSDEQNNNDVQADDAVASDTNTQVEELTLKLEQANTAKLQLMADFQNFRKRMEEQQAKFGLMANMQIVLQLLEVMDDLQMAIHDEDIDLDHAKVMLNSAMSKLNESVNSVGVDVVEIKEGDKFDPNIMEALTTNITEDDSQDNTVKTVVSKAYKYQNGELLRTAKVIVNKYKAAA